MKLKTNLYTISRTEQVEGGADYDIELNPDSIIYKAHFPEFPVTPGVCIIEIGHELLEEYKQCPLAIKTVKNVKFLSVITPREVLRLTYQIRKVEEDETGQVKAQISVVGGETAYAKISIICQK